MIRRTNTSKDTEPATTLSSVEQLRNLADALAEDEIVSSFTEPEEPLPPLWCSLDEALDSTGVHSFKESMVRAIWTAKPTSARYEKSGSGSM